MDTIVAPITPLINSAIIVVRISGDDALKSLQLFDITNLEHRRVYNATYKGSELRDDVILTFFKAPHSYTGEDLLEVSFHGNPLIVSSFISDCYKLGFRFAEPGEFTKRRFLNGKIDLSQAESILDLISSKSKYSVQFSYNTLTGALKKKVDSIISKMVDIGSVIEAFIEFPDEELDQSSFDNLYKEIDFISNEVSTLISNYNTIQHYKTGFSVVIAGKPNVGKSSLLNFLLSQERSIVSDIPGTTRDYILEYANLGGIPIKLIDTAGVRISSDTIEKLGIDRSLEMIQHADLVIVLLDASSFDDEDRYILDITKYKTRLVFVNKVDLINKFDISHDLAFSLKYSIDVEKIVPQITQKLSLSDSDAAYTSVLINDRHLKLFKDFLSCLNALVNALTSLDLDVAAFELQQSLNILYEITGERYTDNILNNIFEKFCIGK
ncbi:tRNA uridine-5-carboxymethylaminomethyl(34) synthesis GTPase MnmE [Calditerrivibrio sp.]|uniref:tRNA uridine-5-carboxymethylaminomethyl(34) synthesis GTPase MnmE n=1 Tax=Calditerrivibrio sp. TaxID=2792612 RepID=UPI003D0D8CD4